MTRGLTAAHRLKTGGAGEISVSKLPGEPLTPSERTLLDDLAAQAGPAFSNVRLTEELRASRQRIVAAQDAERRRIERDLHDGAQQHLVAISVNLRVVQELIEADVAAARELLVEVQGQATEALATMRDLARGIYPPALADRGIAAALEAHLAKSRQRSTLEWTPLSPTDGLHRPPRRRCTSASSRRSRIAANMRQRLASACDSSESPRCSSFASATTAKDLNRTAPTAVPVSRAWPIE